MARSKNMSQANLLRQEGVPALGILNTPNRHNPITIYNPNKARYVNLWTNYDLNQCCNRYYWEGLPDGLTSWNLERMLYFRGSLAGFSYGGKVYIMPYVIDGDINPYGLPTHIRPVTYNGEGPDKDGVFVSTNFKLPIDHYGNEEEDYSAVILYDSMPVNPAGQPVSRYALNQAIINDIADTLARVNINVVISNKKIMLQVKDPKQRDIVEQELENVFKSDCPFGVVTSEIEATSIQATSDFNALDLMNLVNNYDNIRCVVSGISSKGFGIEKKERVVTGELAGEEEKKDLILDTGLQFRELFADLMNKKFGCSMKPYARADEYKEEQMQQQMKAFAPNTEFNGKGRNAKEEAEK